MDLKKLEAENAALINQLNEKLRLLTAENNVLQIAAKSVVV
jgi:hypothetical protein